jgi:hypothetical protein
MDSIIYSIYRLVLPIFLRLGFFLHGLDGNTITIYGRIRIQGFHKILLNTFAQRGLSFKTLSLVRVTRKKKVRSRQLKYFCDEGVVASVLPWTLNICSLRINTRHLRFAVFNKNVSLEHGH